MEKGFPAPSHSATPAGCPTIQFWHCLPGNWCRIPQVKDSVLQDCPSFPVYLRHQCQVPVVLCASDQPAIKQKFPWPPSWVWLICHSDRAHRTQKNSLLTGLLVYYKKTELTQMKNSQGEVCGKGLKFPWALQAPHPPSASVHSPTWELSKHCHLAFLWKLQDVGWLMKSLAISDQFNPWSFCPQWRASLGTFQKSPH